MKVYNTLTRKKENFKPIKIDKVKVYYCGPTPYDFAHIGNLRAYLFSDMVVRTLKFLGYKIETSMNITDIDDKTIRDSQKNNEDLFNYTQKYIDAFFEDLDKLRIPKADNVIRISQIIDTMVTIINVLLKKGYAYLASDGSIYYSIEKFSKYGELANLDFKGMKSSVRIDNDEYEKDQAADFVLWKAYNKEKEGPNKWRGEFVIDGEKQVIEGRPGWHIECSACNLKFFGEQIDIHMGAVDNIFPHHQNEIAQSEAYSGKKFSNYWMHAGHLLVNNKKMSKSLGNFYTLRDLEEKFADICSKEVLFRGYRFSSYLAKYGDSFNFTEDKLHQSIVNIKSFDETIKRIANYKPKTGKTQKTVSDNLQEFLRGYISNLEDDFNTVEAVVYLFDFIKYINYGIDKDEFNSGDIDAIVGLLKTFNEVLDVINFDLLQKTKTPKEILDLLQKRVDAKDNKNYQEADKIRSQIEELGYKVIDDKDGARAEKLN